MKRLLLALLSIFFVSGIFAQLDDFDQLLYLDFEDDAELTLNDEDMTADEVDYTAEASTDAYAGTGAASFDGTQYIIFDPVEEMDLNTTSYTWAMWVKTTSDGGSFCAWAAYSGTPAAGNGEFDENDEHSAGVHSLFYGFTGGSATFDVGWVALTEGATAINDGNWHHVAVTVDNENFVEQVYIDGAPEGEEPGDWDIAGDLADLYSEEPDMEPDITTFRMKVGYATSGWPADEEEEVQLAYFSGVMDEFRMYEGALTADDVLELFELEVAVNSVNYQDFKVYPNPATDYIRLTSDREISEVSIYNAIGQEVLRMNDVTKGSSIYVSHLQDGIYFVKTQDVVQKLIIR